MQVELTSRYNELDWRKDMKSLLCSVYTDQHSAFLLNNIQVMNFEMECFIGILGAVCLRVDLYKGDARIDAGRCQQSFADW